MKTLVVLLGLTSGLSMAQAAPFHFEVQEGRNLNYMLRDGETAAHVVLRSGSVPRILVAFPAGDSGVGVWFEQDAQWHLDAPPTSNMTQDATGRPLHGIVFEVSAAASHLTPKQAVLSSVRVLRDYESLHTVPAEVAAHPQVLDHVMIWARNRLDGAPGYQLTLDVMNGTLAPNGQITAGSDGRIKLRVGAATGEKPLTPLSGHELLNGMENPDPRARDTLTFLSFQEKFLAGSWRFDTYFGRDTLMSVRLLMPVLAPEATEDGLRSVLARLSPQGEVAHEETIGELAVLNHKRQDNTLSDAPIFDYSMIDGDYLLAPVIADYLLTDAQGRRRAAAFLRSDNGAGTPVGAALLLNLRWVATHTARFATHPAYQNLIQLKPGRPNGEWRDSGDGLGGGRYPYDVNGVLVPAALEATHSLLTSGLLNPYLAAGDRRLLDQTAGAAHAWGESAHTLFNVTLDSHAARDAVEAYAKQLGVPAADALQSLGSESLGFHAISLAASGRPIPIVNSDEGFRLLFATPSPEELAGEVASVMRPFPAGLMTGAGMVVANPVFADAALKERFTNHAYHGTVVWSWQQALFASGLERQLRRTDLPDPVRRQLRSAQQALWHVIRATASVSNSELWSWRFEGNRYRVEPFGASGADADESNAAQLWSSVYLAVREPGH